MAILRAGPFATSIDSFVSIDGTWDGEIPVNCAKDSKSFWPWRARIKIDENPLSLETGSLNLFAAGYTIPDLDELSLIEVFFYYQASEAWSFAGSAYESTAESLGGTDTIATAQVFIAGTQVFYDSESEGKLSSVSGTFDSIVFPASVVPVLVRILLFSGVFSETGGNATSSLTLPIIST
jgi:hypothetical protein